MPIFKVLIILKKDIFITGLVCFAMHFCNDLMQIAIKTLTNKIIQVLTLLHFDKN